MELTDTFNPFSVGQTHEFYTILQYTLLHGARATFPGEGSKGQRETSIISSIQQLRGTTCLRVRALDPLLTSARGPHWALGFFWTIPSPWHFLVLSMLKIIIFSEDGDCMSGSIKTVNVGSEDFI